MKFQLEKVLKNFKPVKMEPSPKTKPKVRFNSIFGQLNIEQSMNDMIKSNED